MERVKKPLQLATEPRAAEPPDIDARRRVADGDIEYAHTRVVPVSAATIERARIVTGVRNDEVSSAYKLLRTQVLHKLAAKRWQTIAVVSPRAGEGKTLTAINLGLAIASTRSHTALLVDLDWRHPSVHRYFDYAPEADVHDYVRGERALTEVLVNPGIARFCYMPCRRPVPDASDLLGSLGDFVQELKNRYGNRIVLFDLPPLLPTDDALSFLPHVDGALLVVEESRTQREDALRSLELIGQECLLGTVINKSSQRQSKY